MVNFQCSPWFFHSAFSSFVVFLIETCLRFWECTLGFCILRMVVFLCLYLSVGGFRLKLDSVVVASSRASGQNISSSSRFIESLKWPKRYICWLKLSRILISSGLQLVVREVLSVVIVSHLCLLEDHVQWLFFHYSYMDCWVIKIVCF